MSTEIKVKPASGKATTMYEVDDTNKMSDKGYAHSHGSNGHLNKLVTFIASLGFDATDNGAGSTSIVIDGETFSVNFNKVSYLSQNRFTRDWKPRADRCIEIMKSWNSILVKIPFNEEIDRDKLVAKIQKEVDRIKESNKAIADAEKNKTTQLEAMRKHYFSSKTICSIVKSISVEHGVLAFQVTGIGFLNVDATTGECIELMPEEIESIPFKSISNWSESIGKKEAIVMQICSELKKIGAVGDDFSKFAKNAHGGSATKDEIEKY